MRWVLALLCIPAVAGAQTFVDQAELDVLTEPAPNGFGAGVAFFDYDGDGWEDLLVGHMSNGVYLYRNGGPPDFEMTDVTLAVGLPIEMTGAVGAGATDVDRDGDMDIVVLDYKHLRLFRWEGARYVEVTDRALPGLPWFPSVVTFGDVDGDGWTDLWVDGYTLALDFPFHDCAPDALLHNRGDGTFEDVAADAGAADPGCGLAALFSDYDRDGDVDVFTGNDFGMFAGSNRLFRNDGLDAEGSVSFTDVSEASGADSRLYGMGVTTADVNDDGWPDYFGTSIGRGVLLLGSPEGVFEDATERYGVMSALGLQAWRVTWGCRFLDVTNDGLWDLAIASGYLGAAPEIQSYPQQPSILYTSLTGDVPSRNDAIDLEIAPSDPSRGIAVADFDDDGDDDVATAAINGGAHLYRNDVGAEPALRVHLTGTVSTPEAYGAWLRLECDGVRREREVVAGGALASSSSPILRMPLAGCPDGGTFTVTWPSGAVTEVDVGGGGERLDLVEPLWIETDGLAPADGVAAIPVRVTPRLSDGSLVGAGHAVVVTSTLGSVAAVADGGDGTYDTTVTSIDAGSAALGIEIDGVSMPAHPRVRFFPAGIDATTLHVSPTRFIADETDVVVTAVPRRTDGTPEGTGRDVGFITVGAVQDGDVTDNGDGSYSATFQGAAGEPFQVRARVDGVPRGPVAQAEEIAGIDPDLSTVRLEPGWVPEGDLDDETSVSIQISPRDGQNDIRSGVGLFTYEIVGVTGEIPILDLGGRSGGVAIRALARDLVDQCPCAVVVQGVTLSRSVAVSSYLDDSELRDAVDPDQSRVAPFLETAYPDGQDYSWVVAELRDAEGDAIPMTDRFSWSSDLMTLVEQKTLYGGTQGKARMRAGVVPGRAFVDVTFDDVPTGARTYVDLPEPPAHDIAHDRVRTCLTPVAPADGDGVVTVEVQAIDDQDFLLGSGYPIAVYGDGVEMDVDYSEPGTYVAILPVPDRPMIVNLQTEVLGTGRGSTLLVEFHDPAGEPVDPGRPECAEVEDGFVRFGTEPDAGPDAGEPDAGGADDAGLDAGPDASTPHPHPRGGGCGCAVAPGGFALLWLAPLALVRRRR